MALPTLPTLPHLGGGFHPDFLPAPGGGGLGGGGLGGGIPPIGGGGGGGANPGTGCTQITDSDGRVISQSGNCGGGSTGAGAGAQTTTAAAAAGCSWYDVFCLAGSQLLRLVLLLLGLLAVAGAIYLYPKTSGLIGAAVKTAKTGAKVAARALEEGAEA